MRFGVGERESRLQKAEGESDVWNGELCEQSIIDSVLLLNHRQMIERPSLSHLKNEKQQLLHKSDDEVSTDQTMVEMSSDMYLSVCFHNILYSSAVREWNSTVKVNQAPWDRAVLSWQQQDLSRFVQRKYRRRREG